MTYEVAPQSSREDFQLSVVGSQLTADSGAAEFSEGAAIAGLRPARAVDIIFGIKPTGCSSVWLERVPWAHEVAGSSPVTPIHSRLFELIISLSATARPADERQYLPGVDFASRIPAGRR